MYEQKVSYPTKQRFNDQGRNSSLDHAAQKSPLTQNNTDAEKDEDDAEMLQHKNMKDAHAQVSIVVRTSYI